MAMIFVCDRCKKKAQDGMLRTVSISNRWLMKNYELCNHCIKDLKKFMEGGDNNE